MSFWVAGAAVVGTVGGALIQSNSAKKAAAGQAGAAGAATAEQQRQYDLARQDQAPYRQIGGAALNQLAALYGLPQYAADPRAEQMAGARPVNQLAPISGTALGGKWNVGGSMVASGQLGGLGKALDPVAGFLGSKHGDENRNLKAFAAESGVMQLPDGRLAMPDGRIFDQSQLQEVAGTWYGATYAPDGDQEGWQQRYDAALGGPPPLDMQQGADGQYVLNGAGGIDQRLTTGPGQSAAPAGPDYSAFLASPDYQFTLGQGQQALERSAAARGGLFSGNTGAALQQYGQGLASTQLNNYTNRLAALAGIGQTSVQNTGQLGFNTGQGVANNLIDAGNARASGVVGQGNAYADALGTIGGAFGNYFNNRNSDPSGIGYFRPSQRRVGG